MGLVKKTIYRDPSRRILGGVCSGLSFYFSVDKVFLRLAFFFCSFFFGVTIPLYVILWAIIPKARTKIEREEMMGEEIHCKTNKRTENIKKHPSQKHTTVAKSNSLDVSAFNKIFMFLILMFCSICLFLIFSFSFSLPFVIDLFRDVDFLDKLKYSLTGILTEEKAFSMHSISTLGKYCIPFTAGLIFALKQLNKIKIEVTTFNYLGIAWIVFLVLNYLL